LDLVSETDFGRPYEGDERIIPSRSLVLFRGYDSSPRATS